MARVGRCRSLVSAGVLVFLSLFCLAGGGKLLVVPMDGSHWLSMRSVLVALSQREHQIVVVTPEVNLNVKASGYYTLKTYPVPLTRKELGASMRSFANDLFERRPFLQRITGLYEKVRVIASTYVSSCTSLLHNQDLMQYLEGSKFDAVLTDPIVPCGQILALHLSIPSVLFLRGLPCGFDLQATQCPDPPSYIPRTFSGNSDRMTFIQRVENLILKSSEFFLCNFAYLPFELLASDVLRRPVTMKELLSHGSIWLKRMDFVFEYPMPVMPNVVFIGGINCGKKKPLSQIFFYSISSTSAFLLTQLFSLD
ncbi:PREDICTED: UDP-glucuronosyltransferase 1-1-like [Calidris pugnax]|uniref:UDP-glucuronosyltransferase 1-1-like n=1 Tax=Calidris pugnax TaxID=198806 RepID=UPI00071CFD23|nr:PREDICTED: UDP-glucuronosyltransferase 1-1-like [Calidris pugnax]